MRKPTYLSLFAGVEGLGRGLDMAWFECATQVEIDLNALGVLAYFIARRLYPYVIAESE